ncbi:MAG: EAL domain-containing protein [Candidatus Accumulibacter sp.]|nr:EAL domain-containing protein [Accumulibacter sp.]
MPASPPPASHAPARPAATPQRMQRALFVAGALFVALLWSVLGVHLAGDRARELQRAQERLDALVGGYEAGTRSALTLAEFALRDIAHEYRDYRERPRQMREALARIKESTGGNPAFFDFAVADAAGEVALSTRPDSPPFAIRDRDYFQFLAGRPEATRFVSRPLASRLAPGRQTAVFARRIAGDGNILLGLALVGLNLDFFGDFYRPDELGHKGVLALIGRDQGMRAYRTGERIDYGAVLSSQEQLFHRLAEAPAGHFAQMGPQDSVRRFYSYRTLDEFDLVVVAGMAESEILTSYHRRRLAYVLGALLLTLLAALGTRALHLRLHGIRRAQDAAHYARLLFEAGDDAAGFYRVTEDGDFVIEDANPAFARIAGLTRGELRGKTPDAAIPDENGAFRRQMLERAVASGEAQTYSVQQNTAQPPRSLLVKATPIADRDGVIRHVATFAVDITGHRAGEARQRLYARVVEQTASAIVVTDGRGDIEYINTAFEKLSGYALAEVRGQNPRLFRSEQTPPERIAQLRAAIARGDDWQGELYNRRKDGTAYRVQATITAIRNEAGTLTHYLAVEEDIGERYASDEQRRLLTQILEQTGEGVMITDMQDRIVGVNPAFTVLTGYAADEVIGRSPKMLSSGLQGRTFYQGMWRALLDTGHWSGEIWNRRKDGRFYAEWLAIGAVRDERGRPTHYVATFSDITAQRRSSERRDRLNNYDGLTDLPNRNLFLDRFRHAIDRAEREPGRLCLLLIDLDAFRALNDSAGHDTGDLLLIETARRIRRGMRRADTVSRLGGDQFAVLIEDQRDAERLPASVERLLGTLARPLAHGEHEYRPSACIGIALYPVDGLDPDALLRSAGDAMRQAKALGPNSYQYANAAMNHSARERLAIERHLRHALERGELSILWQPQIELASGRLTGLEALLRWHSAALGEIEPARFIPIAEEAGLMIPIGYWVLQEIGTQSERWRTEGLAVPRIGINFSAQQLRDANLAEALSATLSGQETADEPSAAAGAARRFALEITEGALARQPEESAALCAALRRSGIGIAIDDFGASFASLAWLARLPIDTLKIERGCVAALPGDAQACAAARAIIAMGRALGLAVLAKGVERPAQADWLRAAGCEQAQGWLLGRELPAAEAGALLRPA